MTGVLVVASPVAVTTVDAVILLMVRRCRGLLVESTVGVVDVVDGDLLVAINYTPQGYIPSRVSRLVDDQPFSPLSGRKLRGRLARRG